MKKTGIWTKRKIMREECSREGEGTCVKKLVPVFPSEERKGRGMLKKGQKTTKATSKPPVAQRAGGILKKSAVHGMRRRKAIEEKAQTNTWKNQNPHVFLARAHLAEFYTELTWSKASLLSGTSSSLSGLRAYSVDNWPLSGLSLKKMCFFSYGEVYEPVFFGRKN